MLLEEACTQPRLPDPRQVMTDTEVRYFKDNGFVLPKVGLPGDATARLCGLVETVLAENRNGPTITRFPHVPKRPGQREGATGGEDIFRIALHPVILAAVSRLLSKNLILWGGEIFAKPAGGGVRTPWHQDCYVPAVQAGRGRDRPRVAMVWIAIDDVGLDNGCLKFIPGSGKAGLLNYIPSDPTDLLTSRVDGSAIDERKAVDAVRPSGYFSCHDFYVVHGANPNLSGRRRAGIAFHYMAAEDGYDRGFAATKTQSVAEPLPIAQRPIWLVLGENRNPVNDFVTGHEGLDELDRFAEKTRILMAA